MPTVDKTPKGLRVYTFHGLDINEREGSDEAIATCPFCDKERKFYVNKETGQFNCKVCDAKGNSVSFLRQLWEHSTVEEPALKELTRERRLLRPETLGAWGVRQSLVTGEWLVPGYTQDGKLSNLYAYRRPYPSSKLRLLPTSDVPQLLYGLPLFDAKKPNVYLAEGAWDAMSLWEIMKATKLVGETYTATSNERASLLRDSNVIGIPGCNVFKEGWSSLFAGKVVYLCCHNDHDRHNPKTGQLIPSPGYAGMKRVAQLLSKSESPPREVHHLYWGEGGFDPSLPHGTDIRDYLSKGKGSLSMFSPRRPLLGELLERFKPIPPDWVPGRSERASGNGSVDLEPLPCKDYRTLVDSFRRAMKWIPGLDAGLSVMLASVVSTPSIGDQLWVKMLSPPSSGKTVLCEALSVAKKYVIAKSTIRGFHSGYQTDREGKEDHSLVALANGKTLITKDGDTLLQSPNLLQILSEARDVYDRTARTHYRNSTSRDYQGLSMTWILCGTESLRILDASELGERFLTVRIMDEIDEELEEEIGFKVGRRAALDLKRQSNCKAESHDNEDMTKAKQLTGGYVEYLRQNAQRLLDQVDITDGDTKCCHHLAQFVSFMRSRPSKRQDEAVQRELSFRLTSQLVRLMGCLCVVRNKTEVDHTVRELVRKVALDTSSGRTFNITRYLFRCGSGGADSKAVLVHTGETKDKLFHMLRFLQRIRIAEVVDHPTTRFTNQPRWRLTSRMERLYSFTTGEVPDLGVM